MRAAAAWAEGKISDCDGLDSGLEGIRSSLRRSAGPGTTAEVGRASALSVCELAVKPAVFQLNVVSAPPNSGPGAPSIVSRIALTWLVGVARTWT